MTRMLSRLAELCWDLRRCALWWIFELCDVVYTGVKDLEGRGSSAILRKISFAHLALALKGKHLVHFFVLV